MKTKKLLKKISTVSMGALLVGATMFGAMAQTPYTLGDYPEPFLKSGKANNLVIVVGQESSASDTIGQSLLLSNLQSLAITPEGSETKSSSLNIADFKNVFLGKALTTELDSELTDASNLDLFDGEINHLGTDLNVQEIVALSPDVKTETSLTSDEDRYADKVYVEYPKDGIKYFYNFDNAYDFNEITSTNPLEIKFLGEQLKITDVPSNTRFSAYVGKEVFLDVGDSMKVDGKTVKLVKVGTDGAIVIDVEGKTAVISKNSSKTIEGIEVKNDETFYDQNGKSSANIIAGKNAVETFNDGDAYVGEDKNNPEWVWNIKNLLSDLATVVSVSGTITSTGITLGIENDKNVNDYSDNPMTVGDCVELPEDYVSLCVDSLTVEDDDYMRFTMEYENSADLSDVNSTLTSVKTIYLEAKDSEGLQLTSSGKKTNKIWLYGVDGFISEVYYKNDDNKVAYDSSVTNDTLTQFASLNFGNTKGNDLKLSYNFNADLGTLELDEGISDISNDKLSSFWKLSSGQVLSLGNVSDSEESDELVWNSKLIGTKDENHRTKYGLIIESPNSGGSSDKVKLKIPSDTVQAKITLGMKTTKPKTTANNTIAIDKVLVGTVNPISSSASALAEEIEDYTQHNIILVGGSAVNPLVEPIFGLTRQDFEPNEAIIRLVENGSGKVAMLVAGYSAVDTRNGAEAIANGKLKGINKQEVKVVSSTQKVGSYTVE